MRKLETRGSFGVPFAKVESAPPFRWRLGSEFNDLGKETMDDGMDQE